MSAPERTPAEGEEPRATIYVPAWLEARERLVWIDDEDARGLLASAMDQVESGWDAVRAVQRWADLHPERDRPNDGYGALLTFAESELQEVFREMAFNLADLVTVWPGQDLPPHNDVDAHRTEFGRYATVLVLATGASEDVPEGFRTAVRQVARLLPGGEWFRRLAETFAAIDDVSGSEITADTARQAVDFLLHAIPEAERDRVGSQLVANLEALYAITAPPPPEWLRLLRAYLAEQAHGDTPTDTAGSE
ncbi:hypothetical protein [Longimicrobium sp.]|uniref:hypothetical protein n=1 Tax=Longimicrobium sp. TaxID=2029185 RepID=UPI003B3B6BB3